MEKVKYFTKNRYGITIVKCCASCRHKQADNRGRICMNGEGQVPTDYLCGEWQMAEGLDNAGKGGGVVKRKEFLDYAINAHFTESAKTIRAFINKQSYTRMSKDDIRSEWEKTHEGGIYYKM